MEPDDRRHWFLFLAGFMLLYAIASVVQWLRSGEIRYYSGFFAPHFRARKQDSPAWFWANLIAFVLAVLLMLGIFAAVYQYLPNW